MKNIYLIVLLVFSCYSLQAQQVFEYDFFNNELINEDFNAENGEFINFKVLDVNPFLYAVSITSQENEYHTKVHDFFKRYLIDIPDENALKLVVNGQNETPYYAQFTSVVNAFSKDLDKYREFLNIVHKEDLSFSKINEIKESVFGVNSSEYSSEVQKKINNINLYYVQFLKFYNSEDSIMKREKEIIEMVFNKLEKAKFENLPNDMNRLLNKINEKSFSFSTSPLKAETDEIIYEITINPIKNEDVDRYGSGSRKEFFNVPIQVQGGFKIDFSTGLFFSNLINHKFATPKDSIVSASDTLKGYRILRNKEGKIKLGLSATAHLYWRWFQDLNIGANFGVGLLPDQGVNYLLGGSIIIGTKKRVIINGGVTTGYVDRLSSLVKENNFYPDVPLEKELTVKELDFGWYLGISYNLTE